MGSDRAVRRLWVDDRRFNSRSRMGSDATRGFHVRDAPCFNSRSRMGSDYCYGPDNQLREVSIHAPAWGATSPAPLPAAAKTVSIHAPAWGATGRDPQRRADHSRFNSRSRMGSDERPDRIGVEDGAFQFTLPHGERPPATSARGTPRSFQFTLPHGERRGLRPGRVGPAKFQFTLPHGERLGGDGGRHDDGLVSIHAPAWGAT